MSGARDDRPGLAALLDYVRDGDTVVVWKLDRLGRNTLHILETVKDLTDRGVGATPRSGPVTLSVCRKGFEGARCIVRGDAEDVDQLYVRSRT
ncbi:recombinase family protein [Mycobacterium sp.]|uniref:recombinase family protein n=1 Tax=Mycobacterium sp. TaxID=1785 RepID=UPI003C73B998